MISHLKKNIGIIQKKREKDLEVYDETIKDHERNYTQMQARMSEIQ